LRTPRPGAVGRRVARDVSQVIETLGTARRHRSMPRRRPTCDPHSRRARSIERMLRDPRGGLEEVILDDRTMARALQEKWIAARKAIRVRWHNGPMPVFDIDDVAGQIDTALARASALASGVEVLFDARRDAVRVRCRQRRAGGRQGARRAPGRVNLEAASGDRQQLRLRNLAGAV